MGQDGSTASGVQQHKRSFYILLRDVCMVDSRSTINLHLVSYMSFLEAWRKCMLYFTPFRHGQYHRTSAGSTWALRWRFPVRPRSADMVSYHRDNDCWVCVFINAKRCRFDYYHSLWLRRPNYLAMWSSTQSLLGGLES